MKKIMMIAVAVCAAAMAARAQDVKQSDADAQAELAKKTQNPVASLISLPMQYNVDFNIGPANAKRQTLNVQPVVPISLNDDWNLIIRTIVPLIDAESPVKGGDDKSGLGDITQSFFFSPKQPVGGWILAAGPVGYYPSASDDALGAQKWGAGPTAVALKQENGWTYGMLANHICSVAGNNDRDSINSTYMQPFLSKTTKTYTTFTLNSESVYNWDADQWTVPVNAMITQLLKVHGQIFSIQLGARYYAEAPDGGPDWGLRAAVTFLFPK